MPGTDLGSLSGMYSAVYRYLTPSSDVNRWSLSWPAVWRLDTPEQPEFNEAWIRENAPRGEGDLDALGYSDTCWNQGICRVCSVIHANAKKKYDELYGSSSKEKLAEWAKKWDGLWRNIGILHIAAAFMLEVNYDGNQIVNRAAILAYVGQEDCGD